MKKLWSTFLIMAALGFLLVLGTSSALAYYPPLQLSATWSSNSVSRTVYHPKRQETVGATSWYGGDNVAVVDLKQQNGVIAWVLRTGAAYYVICSVYDPGPDRTKEDTQGPFSSVAGLAVQDGVIVYVGDSEFRYTTYDPAKGGWRNKSYVPYGGMGINLSNLSVATKNGVVVYTYNWEISGITSFDIRADIYDCALGKWFGDVAPGVPEVIFTDSFLTCQYTITNSTIYTDIYHPTLGYQYSDIRGYDPPNHYWYHGTTKPLAYFAPQPGGGMWFWFTDMSIGGATWSWNFGDGGSGADRSPYHIFPHAGVFTVTQNINSGISAYSRSIPVGLTPLAVFMLLMN